MNILGGTKLYGEWVGGMQCLNSHCKRVLQDPKAQEGKLQSRRLLVREQLIISVSILAFLSRADYLIAHHA